MSSAEILDRNWAILHEKLVAEMNDSLEFGNQLIDEEMHGLSSLARPIVKAFYAMLVKKDLEDGTLKNINGVMKISRKMIEENIEEDSDQFYAILKEKFPIYAKNDQTSRQCKHDHKNFPTLLENLKLTFEWEIRPTMRMLKVDDPDITGYHSMVVKTFPNAEECKEVLRKQLDYMQYGLKVIQQDMTILNIPTARDFIFRILTKGFARKTDQFMNDIDVIFNSENQ
jgi:hypothetical protein